jgi:trk system potassium uptake protein
MSYYWNYKNVFNSTGQIILYSSFTFLIPFFMSLFFNEGRSVSIVYFLIFLFCLLFGYLLYKSIPKQNILGQEDFFSITFAQSLIVVCLVWLLYVFFASLPFYFLSPQLSLLDAYFESMSSLTTTGLTMYSNLVPNLDSLAVWRSLISWIGGLGIIVLAFFGFMKGISNSSKLISAEGHDRLRPSFKKTIKSMWIIYLIITIVGIVLLYLFGMSLFDAFNYSMSAVSTTGSQSNALSLSVIGNVPIYITLIIIMLLGATSFILHFSFFIKRSFKVYFKDSQFIGLLILILIASIIVFLKLKTYSYIDVLLSVVSLVTCGSFTLFTPTELLIFPPFILLIFLILMFIGGSTNSTTGGIKLDRFIIAIKSIYWKVRQINLPNIAYFAKKYNGSIVDNARIRTVYFLIFIFLFFILLGTLAFTFHGYSIHESLFEVVSAQSNVGFTIGLTDASMPSFLKFVLIINMWVGRLEIIPILSVIGMLFSRKYLI